MAISTQQFLLGLGTGRCGTVSLAGLLNQQFDVSVTHEESPLLDWYSPAKDERLDARLARMEASRDQSIVGDVASFYLPYARQALERYENLRMVCMRRERDKTIDSFCRWLDRVHPLPTDHWRDSTGPGFFHEPVWSRIFPKFEADSREEAIGKYWDFYYEQAEELRNEYSERFQIFDLGSLSDVAGQHRILSFCGISESDHVIDTSLVRNQAQKGPQRYAPAAFSPDPNDPRRCAVIVPHGGSIVPGCESGLRDLERAGYVVKRVGGYAAIDQGRNQMATDALIEGFEETMWIDSDIVFNADAVDMLRRNNLPICSGIYSQKGKQAIASHILRGTPEIRFGTHGGLLEILYAAGGFLHVRREVYQQMQLKLELPVCNERFGNPMLPFFAPKIIPADEGHWYLAEDFAFCHRARECGYSIVADTRIRLWHVGNYSYGWENSGTKPQRHTDFTLTFSKKPTS